MTIVRRLFLYVVVSLMVTMLAIGVAKSQQLSCGPQEEVAATMYGNGMRALWTGTTEKGHVFTLYTDADRVWGIMIRPADRSDLLCFTGMSGNDWLPGEDPIIVAPTQPTHN